MRTDRIPLSIFVKQKVPGSASSGSPPAPTSADVKKKLMEVLDNMSDANAIAAISKVLHEQPQSPPQPAPWEGIAGVAQALGINLGDLWRTREEELKSARDAADATSRELHEVRLREIDNRMQQLQAIADKVQQLQVIAGQAPQEKKGFLDRLDEITNGMVTKRFASLLGQDSDKKPVDPVDEFFNRLDQVEKIKQRFGNTGGGGVQALAQSGIRGELLKLLLEDEQARLKMKYEQDTQAERNKFLETLTNTLKENVPLAMEFLVSRATHTEKPLAETTAYEPKGKMKLATCDQCGKSWPIPEDEASSIDKCPFCGT